MAALLAPAPGWPLTFPLGVAYSGGADSTALLWTAARRWPGQVVALHVHHGLQAAADEFERHCKAACASLEVPLHVVRVNARHARGESPEEVARIARYAALASMSAPLGVQNVLLAQHADDQVETLLLALSRGAGVPGLAAMSARFERHGLRFYRPLLDVSGAAIRRWLDAQGMAYIVDPSNANMALTRNKIRLKLLPALEAAFPQFRETFGRSARNAAQAQELLDDIAIKDIATVGDPPAIRHLQQLSRARQANVLRHWLKSAHGAAPSAAQLDELLDQVAACTTRGHRIRIKVGLGFVERRAAVLGWYNP